MKKTILVAGGTGNLGGRIIRALLEKGASVRMIVRANADAEKLAAFEKAGVAVFKVDMTNPGSMSDACRGADCVVSALHGLRDVIVDTQKVILDAAVAAGVPRFIPSDYSTDFTKLPAGENRNFDLRREFHVLLEKAPVKATSIFNGAFADILTYNTPMLNLKNNTVGYWGESADWHLDFTTMDDTAAFTAEAALDDDAPRYLRIAGFQVSPNELEKIAGEVTGSEFKLIPMGDLATFGKQIKQQRAENPEGENELYPRWQSGQYMHGQFSTQHESLDNARYSGLTWTGAPEFVRSMV